MNTRIGKSATILLLVVLAYMVPGPETTQAQLTETPVPRILLVGDSYDAFMWWFRSFKAVLPEFPGLEGYIEVGSRTAIMGVKAC